MPCFRTRRHPEGPRLSGGTISGALTGSYSISGSRGTATVDQPVFGSDDLVFYIFGPDGFVVMGSGAVLDDGTAFFHI